MKKLCILSALVTLAVAGTVAFCSPVLISVELPTVESKKVWHRLNIPTYELIGNTAIAQTDESLIGQLKQRGYRVNIIDQQPDLSKYVILSEKDKAQAMTETSIWQSDRTAIIKPASKSSYFDREYKHIIRSMNNKPLGERFWKSVTTKYVPLKNIPYDPFIQSLVDQVNGDSIASYIQRLQDYKTRLAFSDSSFAASQWIYDRFFSYGYNVEYDSFYVEHTLWNTWPDTGYERSVIASVNGVINPEKLFIVSGHFDAIIQPDTSAGRVEAPGADDNASGIAGVLEVARIFGGKTWESSIKYAGWSAEEIGGLGSGHFAETADSLNQNINGVINMDMIGFMNDTSIDANIWYHGEIDEWLSKTLYNTAKTFVPQLFLYQELKTTGSDEILFFDRGYPAICLIEKDYSQNPYYHTLEDKISTLDPRVYTAVIKSTVAALAVLNIYPSAVDSVVAQDAGNGTSMIVKWISSSESDVSGYKVYYGLESEAYSDTHNVIGATNTTDTLKGLYTDSTYYISVNAVDNEGHESYVAYEVFGTAKTKPLAPSGVSALPISDGIVVMWTSNTELDLEGYRIYRSTDSGLSYDSLNAVLLADTTYTDQPLSGANKYYYKVRSFDQDGNCSPFTDSAYARPITLDQGILLVDETNNWTTGSFPRDAQQDSFYNYIFSGYKNELYEYGLTAQKPILADFGPYSTVAWLADDYASLLASGTVNDLKGYLDAGGKLWLAGWKPSGDLHNSITYPADYTTGDVSYDHFKITHAGLSGATDSFKTALGLKGYPDLAVDTLKYPASTLWGKTMRYIEALTPAGAGDTIYVMDMRNNSSMYQGRACAVRDSGKTVFFGFPMYFMDKGQAKLAAQKVMAEFGEVPLGVTGKPENLEKITDRRLLQNAPNPFSQQTSISYQLPKAGQVKLNVYNIAGQLVKTLVNREQQAGSYTVKWDSRDDNGLKVSNGVYVYKLEVSGIKGTKKMLLLR